jgi:D-amino peptidase
MNYLVATDLEGIHGVVGEPYQTLTASFDYGIACENAVKEINAAVKALFDAGADTVAVWDNHGGGNNIDISKVDSRAVIVKNRLDTPRYRRFDFDKDIKFDGVVYLGYHAREGSFGGVLAHTYSSTSIQYFKFGGVPVGELEIDTCIAAERGIAPLFIASDDVCITQTLGLNPDTVRVVTKYGKGRNKAEFIPEEQVLDAIYSGVLEAAKKDIKPTYLHFPEKIEVRYSRAESAEKKMEELKVFGVESSYGMDSHTVVATMHSIADLEAFLR